MMSLRRGIQIFEPVYFQWVIDSKDQGPVQVLVVPALPDQMCSIFVRTFTWRDRHKRFGEKQHHVFVPQMINEIFQSTRQRKLSRAKNAAWMSKSLTHSGLEPQASSNIKAEK